jgi:hypothetical protein
VSEPVQPTAKESASTAEIIPVGIVEGPAAQIVMDRSGTTQVKTVSRVRAHWRTDHSRQFDIEHAEGMMADVLSDPLRIYQDRRPHTLAFIGDFDETHYLIIPIKCLEGEIWVATMYVEDKARFVRRAWVQNGLLYEKE